MISKKNIRQISPWIWEIPKKYKKGMKVPGRFYSSEDMIKNAFDDRSLEQLSNICTLPRIQKYGLAMPDFHQGYGFPIGGVAATKYPNGVISPGGVGYDISCSIRLLKSSLEADKIEKYLDKLAQGFNNVVPSGLGKGRSKKFTIGEIEKIIEGGSQFLVEQGKGRKEDLVNCEENGRLSEASAAKVSKRAKERGRDQAGTLGSGNHFLEIQKVDQIFDEGAAEAFGLFKGQAVVMVHTGSRGLGHQIATDYIKLMLNKMKKYNINLPDKELNCVPFNSEEGQSYYKAMCCGANFSWANKQIITEEIRDVWKKILGNEEGLSLVYDVAHNIAKIEEHEGEKLIVHRKGATRAFPPGHKDVPEKYRKVGKPVLIPGSMGTSSYVLKGVNSAKQSFYSTCHGAGRSMSRTQAKKETSGAKVKEDLKRKGIILKSHSLKGIAEEASLAYKNIDKVVEAVCDAGLSKKVVKLKPLAVIKGE